jgi:pimeloyl-ACP methyl ester carboxylesterase
MTALPDYKVEKLATEVGLTTVQRITNRWSLQPECRISPYDPTVRTSRFGSGSGLQLNSMMGKWTFAHEAAEVPTRFGAPRLLADAEIRGIACPVLMMFGAGDAFFSAERTIKRLTKLLRKEVLESLSTAGG